MNIDEKRFLNGFPNRGVEYVVFEQTVEENPSNWQGDAKLFDIVSGEQWQQKRCSLRDFSRLSRSLFDENKVFGLCVGVQ